MKRFTETSKWGKPWHQDLPCRIKCLWDYLCANCNAIGVWEPNLSLASFQIGETISANDLKYFKGKVEVLEDGKWLVVQFMRFQYGELSKLCPAHKPIYRLLGERPDVANRVLDTLSNRVLDTLQEKEEEEERDKEGEKRGIVKGENEILDERTAIEQANMSLGVQEDFARYAYQDWSSRGGKDAAGVDVTWTRYLKKRWEREKEQWKDGTHKGKNNGKSSGKPNLIPDHSKGF
jgi:hypothetical protein